MARPKKPPIQNTCKHCFVMFETRPSSARDFCTKKCAQQHKGVDREWMEKRKKTCLEKYGNEIAFKSKEVQDKYKNNLIEKYGVNNPFLVKEFKDKSNNTVFERYGYKFATQNKDISDKISVKLKGQIHDRKNFVNLKWEKLVNYQNTSGMVPLFDKEYLEQNKMNHLKRFVLGAGSQGRMNQKEIDHIRHRLVIQHRNKNVIAVILLSKKPFESKHSIG